MPANATVVSVATASLSIPATSSALTDRNAPGSVSSPAPPRRWAPTDIGVDSSPLTRPNSSCSRLTSAISSIGRPWTALTSPPVWSANCSTTTRSRDWAIQRSARITAVTVSTLLTLHSGSRVGSPAFTASHASSGTSSSTSLIRACRTSSANATIASQRTTGPQPREARPCTAPATAASRSTRGPGLGEGLEGAYQKLGHGRSLSGRRFQSVAETLQPACRTKVQETG